ncbi:MAG: hypothetical protein HUU14_03555 [Dehalococcoidia bacterium]|nr:MAG: hypothetical protein EDM76_06905 [bacterium]MCE7927816.1 hypothetical protein [Chloroflexi bacterium CFX7]MCK6563967.1 hypothetical protein [Dehalococcoidia bacterium]MCL4230311.1 hypothetical protein [Dehalococcoidia bacterium]NUQ54945.1 hypothetical protein [Dehalococcoidia bacterium]
MAEIPLPDHVTIRRRDGQREVLLHRSVAVIGDDRVEIKAARSTIFLPLAGLAFCAAAGYLMVARMGHLPFWVLVLLLVAMIFLVPLSGMSLVNSIVGAEVVADRAKNSVTWQQGYLGMGVGTKELTPFEKIAHLEVTVEGGEPNRWQDLADDLRQFELSLVKVSGKRLRIARVPVPAFGETDGMDRTLAVGQAISAITGAPIRLPEGWEMVEIDTGTGEIVSPGKGSLPPADEKKEKNGRSS